jgi:hypothetical protein
MPGPAAWSMGAPVSSVDVDGTLHASVEVDDGGVLAGTLTFTLTADRDLLVVVTSAPGAAGLTGFQAWSSK